MIRKMFLLTALLAMTSCADDGLHLQSREQQIVNWHRRVTEDDRVRLGHWRPSMISALEAARANNPSAVDGSGVTLLPDAALAPVAFGAGQYRCQVLKIGAQDLSTPAFNSLPVTRCVVTQEGKLLHFMASGGPQRPQGMLYSDNNRRMILLGTMVLGDEAMAQMYGHDTTRDIIGIVERVGDHHWRILCPAPHFESLFDVIDITPAA